MRRSSKKRIDYLSVGIFLFFVLIVPLILYLGVFKKTEDIRKKAAGGVSFEESFESGTASSIAGWSFSDSSSWNMPGWGENKGSFRILKDVFAFPALELIGQHATAEPGSRIQLCHVLENDKIVTGQEYSISATAFIPWSVGSADGFPEIIVQGRYIGADGKEKQEQPIDTTKMPLDLTKKNQWQTVEKTFKFVNPPAEKTSRVLCFAVHKNYQAIFKEAKIDKITTQTKNKNSKPNFFSKINWEKLNPVKEVRADNCPVGCEITGGRHECGSYKVGVCGRKPDYSWYVTDVGLENCGGSCPSGQKCQWVQLFNSACNGCCWPGSGGGSPSNTPTPTITPTPTPGKVLRELIYSFDFSSGVPGENAPWVFSQSGKWGISGWKDDWGSAEVQTKIVKTGTKAVEVISHPSDAADPGHSMAQIGRGVAKVSPLNKYKLSAEVFLPSSFTTGDVDVFLQAPDTSTPQYKEFGNLKTLIDKTKKGQWQKVENTFEVSGQSSYDNFVVVVRAIAGGHAIFDDVNFEEILPASPTPTATPIPLGSGEFCPAGEENFYGPYDTAYRFNEAFDENGLPTRQVIILTKDNKKFKVICTPDATSADGWNCQGVVEIAPWGIPGGGPFDAAERYDEAFDERGVPTRQVIIVTRGAKQFKAVCTIDASKIDGWNCGNFAEVPLWGIPGGGPFDASYRFNEAYSASGMPSRQVIIVAKGAKKFKSICTPDASKTDGWNCGAFVEITAWPIPGGGPFDAAYRFNEAYGANGRPTRQVLIVARANKKFKASCTPDASLVDGWACSDFSEITPWTIPCGQTAKSLIFKVNGVEKSSSSEINRYRNSEGSLKVKLQFFNKDDINDKSGVQERTALYRPDDGLYQVEVNVPEKYKINSILKVKGNKHLRMKFCRNDQADRCTESDEAVGMNFSGEGPVNLQAYPLLPGDVAGKDGDGQDQKLDSWDITRILSKLEEPAASRNRLYDLNYDNIVDIEDLYSMIRSMVRYDDE